MDWLTDSFLIVSRRNINLGKFNEVINTTDVSIHLITVPGMWLEPLGNWLYWCCYPVNKQKYIIKQFQNIELYELLSV